MNAGDIPELDTFTLTFTIDDDDKVLTHRLTMLHNVALFTVYDDARRMDK